MRGISILLMAGALFGASSGCLDDDRPADTHTVETASGSETAIDWHGHLGTMAAVCPAGVGCIGEGVTLQSAWDSYIEFTNATALDAELTWSADASGNSELAIGVATACNGGCEFVDYAVGSSPLVLNASMLDPAVNYILVVWHPGSQEAGVFYQYGIERDFHVTGTLHAADPAAVTDA